MQILCCYLAACSLAVHALLGCCRHHDHADAGHAAVCAQRDAGGRNSGGDNGDGHDGATEVRTSHADCGIGCQGACVFLPAQKVAPRVLTTPSFGALAAAHTADLLAPQIARRVKFCDRLAADHAMKRHRLLQVWRV